MMSVGNECLCVEVVFLRRREPLARKVCTDLLAGVCFPNLNQLFLGEKYKGKGIRKKKTGLLRVYGAVDNCIYLLKHTQRGLKNGWSCESRKSKGEVL